MKILGVVLIAGLVAASGVAEETARVPERKVMVCMETGNDFFVIQLARPIAAGMFAKAGVAIEWHSDLACPPYAIQISFSDRTDPAFLPGAFAYSLPYEGTHIRVFYDRLQQRIEPRWLPGLLAHVLVHEITHILQAINRHSVSGVMKAPWLRADYNEMRFKPLPFTQTDVDLIHKGVDARESRLATANVAPKPAAR